MTYYHEDVLLGTASLVGTLVKFDQQALKIAKGKFARIYVEIDLNRPIMERICVDDQ